jgi:hypothetical protein
VPAISQNLEKTLHGALALANEHHHEYATLEHLLFKLTDDFAERLLGDATFLARYIERVGGKVAAQVLSSMPADGRSQEPAPTVPADGGPTEAPPAGRAYSASDLRAQAFRLGQTPKD